MLRFESPTEWKKKLAGLVLSAVIITAFSAVMRTALRGDANPQPPLSESVTSREEISRQLQQPTSDLKPRRNSEAMIVLPAHAAGVSPARTTRINRPEGPHTDETDDVRKRQKTNPDANNGPHVRDIWPELSECDGEYSILPVGFFLDEPSPESARLVAGPPPQHIADGRAVSAAVWPNGDALLSLTAKLPQWSAGELWRHELATAMEELHATPTIADPRVPQLLGRLAKLAEQLDGHIMANSTTPAVTADMAQGRLSDQLRRLQHQLQIRVDIWMAAHESASSQFDSLSDVPTGSVYPPQLGSGQQWLANLDPAWRDHLGIDALQRACQSEPLNAEEIRAAARHVLARLSSPILNAEQNDYLRQQIAPEVVEWLLQQARGPLDLPDLLAHIESYLDTSHGYHAHAIAAAYQGLIWHQHPRYRALGQQIETHFRNANLRISASDVFLNMIVPDLPDTEEPVQENIMGAQVFGRSRVANRLQVRLLPDTERIHLRLDAIGLIRSTTQATRGGFVVDNLGTTRFQATKPLMIGRHGLASGPPEATVDSESQVVGLRSSLDGIPFLSGLARRLAENQIASQKQAATRQMNRRVEQKVKHRLNSEIESQLDEIRGTIYHGLIQPLIAFDLEPFATETRTTHDRLILCYRLAGIDQLAAATPRPGGVQSSLLAMQVHQSAINNLLARIQLSQRVLTPDELTQHLGEVFGIQFVPDQRGADIDLRMEFAPFDPIAFEFEDGLIAIKLNIRQMQINRGKTWKRLSVTARYAPQLQGTHLILEQDPSGVRVNGGQMSGRDQLAVSGILNAVFKSRYEVHMIPDTLQQRLGRPVEISQFEITDGWLAISLNASRVEPANPQRPARIGLLNRP